jgi:hypothetical protein
MRLLFRKICKALDERQSQCQLLRIVRLVFIQGSNLSNITDRYTEKYKYLIKCLQLSESSIGTYYNSLLDWLEFWHRWVSSVLKLTVSQAIHNYVEFICS